MSIPVIVDCDPGHDDVLALWLAAGHPALDLLAVTTVGGNVPIEHTRCVTLPCVWRHTSGPGT